MADLLTRLRAVVAADNAIVQAKADRRAQDIRVYGEQFGRRMYSRNFWLGLYAAREHAERELWGARAHAVGAKLPKRLMAAWATERAEVAHG